PRPSVRCASAPVSASLNTHRPAFGQVTVLRLPPAQLADHPLCERCEKAGRITPATVVHHRKAYKGDWPLFIDPDNHESLCAPHHDTLAQREEARGYVIGCDEAGRPVDPQHPWNRT